MTAQDCFRRNTGCRKAVLCDGRAVRARPPQPGSAPGPVAPGRRQPRDSRRSAVAWRGYAGGLKPTGEIGCLLRRLLPPCVLCHETCPTTSGNQPAGTGSRAGAGPAEPAQRPGLSETEGRLASAGRTAAAGPEHGKDPCRAGRRRHLASPRNNCRGEACTTRSRTQRGGGLHRGTQDRHPAFPPAGGRRRSRLRERKSVSAEGSPAADPDHRASPAGRRRV